MGLESFSKFKRDSARTQLTSGRPAAPAFNPDAERTPAASDGAVRKAGFSGGFSKAAEVNKMVFETAAKLYQLG